MNGILLSCDFDILWNRTKYTVIVATRVGHSVIHVKNHSKNLPKTINSFRTVLFVGSENLACIFFVGSVIIIQGCCSVMMFSTPSVLSVGCYQKLSRGRLGSARCDTCFHVIHELWILMHANHHCMIETVHCHCGKCRGHFVFSNVTPNGWVPAYANQKCPIASTVWPEVSHVVTHRLPQ